MFGRKKGFSASQSQRMSRRMNAGMVGTHHAAPARRSSAGRRANASSVDFSSSRKQRRATRGYVDNIGAASSSGETAREHSRRVSQREYLQSVQRKSRAKGIAIALSVVLAMAAVAGFVGVSVFFGSVNSKLSLGDSNVESALVAPASADDAYYVLCAARLGSAQGSGGAETDEYLLVHVNAADKALAFVRVPSNVSVKLSDGNAHYLYEAADFGGDAALVSAVSSLTGVNIAHFVRTDEKGLQELVDVAGDMTLTLSEEVDDPAAGSIYLPAGEQTVTHDNVLVLLRASNFSEGIATQTKNQAAFMTALARGFLQESGIGFALQLDRVAACVQTDMDAQEIMALADALRGFDAESPVVAVLPGSVSGDKVKTYMLSSARVQELMQKIDAGEDPAAVGDALASIVSADYTVEVRNGAGIVGAAAKCGELLQAAGFTLGNVGNSQDYVTYPETLVIYKDSANKQAAEAVVQAIGAGRATNSGIYYEFDTDVLVVIGQDWQPIV